MNAATQLARQETSASVTPMALLDRAVSENADLDKLAQLMDLQERWEAKQAKQAYDEAMAAFKADPPVLERDAEGHNKKKYTSHEQMMRKVSEALAKHGLSHTFETSQVWENGSCVVTVTCVVSHVAGHATRTPASSLPDTSGGKNAIQALGSAFTYLQRYSLKAALGLGEKNDETDDDGKAAQAATETKASVQQVAMVREGLQETGSDVSAFLDWLQAESLEAMTPAQAERGLKAIHAKKAKSA